MARDNKNNYPLPAIIDPDRICIQLEIPNEFNHIAAFWGQVWELTYWNKWNRDTEQTGRAVADVWRDVYLKARDFNDNIGCEDEMTDCCTEPAITRRINPTTGNMEQSTDGGATWKPAAGGINSWITQPVPPVTSGISATKCDAATNVGGQVDQWITQVSNDFDTATSLLEFGQAVILAIAGAVLTVLTGGALAPVEALLIAALGAALIAVWGAGKAVFDAYWTTGNKDKILCAAFCNIGEDGSFTDAQFSAFWNDCNIDLPASPAKMLFMGFLSSVGKEGLNAMAASGMAADADCEDCACNGCVDLWHWPVAQLGENATVVEDVDMGTITADAVLLGGFYYFAFESTHCCNVSIELLSGSLSYDFNGYIPCPDLPEYSFYVETQPPWVNSGLMISNTNCFAVLLRSTSAFTAKITFGS